MDSSAISSIGYDSDSSILEVEFASGVIWRYYGVSEDVYQSFLYSGSKGRFFHTHIRNKYSGEEV